MLYQVMMALEWSQCIAEYLQTHILPTHISLARKRAIETEAKSYALIGNQLYHRGKDQKLRLCVIEIEYILVLEQAHADLSRGHFSSSTTSKVVMTSKLWWPTLF